MNRQRIKLLTVSAFLVWPGLWAQEEMKRARDMMDKGSYKDAVVLLDEAFKTYPTWYAPLILRGQCHLALKHYAEAVKDFENALTFEVPSKDIPAIKYQRAQAFFQSDQHAKAYEAFTELLPLVKGAKTTSLHYFLGICAMELGTASQGKADAKAKHFFSSAIEHFAAAASGDGGNADIVKEASYREAYARNQMSQMSGDKKGIQASIAGFEEVIGKHPDDQRAHQAVIGLQAQLIGMLTDKAGKTSAYAQLNRYLEAYLARWPGDTDMLFKKGQALQGAKQYEKAIAVFEKVLGPWPQRGDVHFALGSCQMAAKKYNEAIASFSEARRRGESANPASYAFAAYCLREQKTGCEPKDIPLFEKATAILEEGQGKVAASHREPLEADLERTRGNLTILRDNLTTANANHALIIENVKNLNKAIAKNRQVLAKNRENMIAQPTTELQAAIGKGEEAIAASLKDLAEEMKKLAALIREAEACGGGSAYPKLAEMKALHGAYDADSSSG